MNGRKSTLEVLEGTNSALWFFMDAFWMMGWDYVAYIMIVPVVVSGIASIMVSEKIAHSILVLLAINSWVLMNVFWMISDMSALPSFLVVAKCLFAVGILFIAMSLLLPGNRKKALSEFKRFRIK